MSNNKALKKEKKSKKRMNQLKSRQKWLKEAI